MKMMTLVMFILLSLVTTSGFFQASPHLTPGEQDTLEGNILLFPEESHTSYIRLTPKKDLDLKAFTLCMRVSTDLSNRRQIVLFTYRTPEFNELSLWQEYGKISLYLIYRNGAAHFNLAPLNPFPTHLCVTWDSSTGLTALWVNGHRSTRKIYRRGHQVNSGGAIVLGQSPGSNLESFNSEHSFEGEITDVQMFDYVLSPQQIKQLYEKQYTRPSGNVLDWSSLKYQIYGNVLVIPGSEDQ